MTTELKYIKGFDGLRALSILLVVLTHLGLHNWLPSDAFFSERLFTVISGNTGVLIFFSISGYLITRLLLIEKANSGKVAIVNFFIRRFLRLAPTLILFFVVVLFLKITNSITVSSISIACSFFYLYNFVANKYYSGLLGHTWSLAVEEQFYLFWPFLVYKLKQSKLIIAILFVLLSCLLAVVFADQISYRNALGELVYAKDYFHLEHFIIPAVAPIMVGALFAVLSYYRLSRMLEDNRNIWIPAIVLAIGPLYLPGFLMKFGFLFQAFGFSMLLHWIVKNQDVGVVKLLELRPIAYIGKISYGIYVWQGLFLQTGPGGKLWIQQFPQNGILTVLVAIGSYHLVEKRILSIKNRFK